MGENKKIAAVCLAAGQGKRMESKVQKQYLLIEDKPVLYYALKAFQDSPVDEVVLVVGQGEEEYCKKEIVDNAPESIFLMHVNALRKYLE